MFRHICLEVAEEKRQASAAADLLEQDDKNAPGKRTRPAPFSSIYPNYRDVKGGPPVKKPTSGENKRRLAAAVQEIGGM